MRAALQTWPLMEGDIVPAAAWTLETQMDQCIGKSALVQFIHRWLGPLTMLFILLWSTRCASADKPAK